MRARVLIVDDEAGTGYALKLLLELDGYEVIVAADGDEGLALAAADPPDFILTDIYMPRLDGLSLIRRMRRRRRLAHVPIIVISSAEPRDLRRALELGARAVLAKPVDYQELLDCLCAYAARGRRRGKPPAHREETNFNNTIVS